MSQVSPTINRDTPAANRDITTTIIAPELTAPPLRLRVTVKLKKRGPRRSFDFAQSWEEMFHQVISSPSDESQYKITVFRRSMMQAPPPGYSTELTSYLPGDDYNATVKSVVYHEQSTEFPELDALAAISGVSNDKLKDGISILESVTLTYAQLKRSRNMADVTLALVASYKMLTGDSVVYRARGLVAKILEPQMSEQAAEFNTQDFTSAFSGLRNSPLARMLVRAVTLATSSALLAKSGVGVELKTLIAAYSEGVAKFFKEADFITSVVDLVSYLINRVGQCFSDGSLRPFFHSERTYKKWADEAFAVIEQDVKYRLPGQSIVREEDHLADLERIICEGVEILKFVRASSDKDVISGTLSKLRIIRATHLVRHKNGGAREQPFAVLVCGRTSAGKSSFVEQLYHHHGKLRNKNTDSHFKYTRMYGDAYWTDFRTHQWCVVLDDVACPNPNKAAEDASVADIIALINNVPFAPPQADIENKGTPAKPSFVIATTNTPHLNAAVWFSNPAAVRRRFKYNIYINPKAEYADPSNKDALADTLDPRAPDDSYYDLWDITVKKVVAKREGNEGEITQVPVEEHVADFSDIYDFFQWYNKVVDNFHLRQEGLVDAFDAVKKIVLCSCCKLPQTHCRWECPNCETLGHRCLCVFQDVTLPSDLTEQAAEVVVYDPPDWRENAAWYLTGSSVAGAAVYMARKRTPSLSELFTRIEESTVEYTKDKVIEVLRRVAAQLTSDYAPRLRKLVVLLGAVAAAYAAYSMINRLTADEQSSEQSDLPVTPLESVGVAPAPAKDETPSPYQKEVFKRPDLDFPPLVHSWGQLEKTKVESYMLQNVFGMIVRRKKGDGIARTNGVCVGLGGHLYVTTDHNLPSEGDIEITFMFEESRSGPSRNQTKKYTQSMLCRFPDSELVFFQNRDYAAKTRVTQLVAPDDYTGDAPGAMLRKTTDGVVALQHLSRVSYAGETPASRNRIIRMWKYSAENEVGHCGSPIMVHSRHGPLIVGLHFLGSNPGLGCAAVSLTQGIVKKAVEHFGDFLFSPNPPMLESEYQKVVVGPNHEKSAILWIEEKEGTIHNYGGTNLPRASSKSHVERTILAEAAEQAGYVQEHFAPPMGGWEVNRNQLLPILTQVRTADETIMRECADAYVAEILAGLSAEDKAELATILDTTSAINGVPGTKFLDSMNFKTSAGFPVLRSKRHVLVDLPPDETYAVKRTFQPNVMQRIQKMRASYLKGKRASPVAVKHNKDEPRSRKKVDAKATRAINGLPVDFCVLSRMFTAPLVRVMMKNKTLFEAMPGLVAQSKEWDFLAKYLKGGLKMDGDYQHYDLKATAAWILEVFRILREILKGCGASEEHLRVVEGMGEDIAFCFVNFDGDLFEFFGHNPSGHTLTVVINCILNSLYSRYAFRKLHPLGIVTDYRLLVRLITYGDDNVKRTLAKWFNHNAISRVLAEIGVTYTAADKSTGEVPFRNLEDITFLKRRFRYDSDLDAYVAPLEEQSIAKSLIVSLPSEKHEYIDAGDRVVTAAREYFWYGKDKYEERVGVLRQILEDSVPEDFRGVEFPTWDRLREEYDQASVDADKYMGFDALERCLTYVRSLHEPGHAERVADMHEQSVEMSEDFVSLFIAGVQYGVLSNHCASVMVGDAVDSAVDRVLSRRPTHPFAAELVEAFTLPFRYKIWGRRVATRIILIHAINQLNTVVLFGSNPWTAHVVIVTVIYVLLNYRIQRKIAVRANAVTRTAAMWMALGGRSRRLVFTPGPSSKVLQCAKPIESGNQLICLTGWHGLEECAVGPSRLGRSPEDLFRSGRSWEPVQSATALMDVCAEYQTSGQTTNTHNNTATRSPTGMDLYRYHEQSEEFTESAPSVVSQQENMRFVDAGVTEVATAPPLGPFQPDSDDIAGLGSFLSRPVLISAFDWLETNTALEQLSLTPWQAFLSDPGIKKKLDNFARLRCRLQLKFVFNASPFFYGSMRACYFPLGEKQNIGQNVDQVRVSQAPGVFLEPQRGTTATLELPMVWPGSWIDLRNFNDALAMGDLRYVLYSKLRSANGVTAARVRISCYAWATDVELAGPTTFTVQSTEYDETGPISGPATAVASVASRLTDVPVIGKMAMATEIGARAVSGVAKMFGLSNPPVIDDVPPMAPKSFHALANVDTRVPIDKLTLDPKNEVTLDNSVAGAGSDDELALCRMLTRESFLVGTGWTQSQTEGTQLFAAAVSPGWCSAVSFGSGYTASTAYAWTPMSYFGQFFDQWRGGITIRFKFIKSKYHTGRVVISWDPQGVPGLDAETLTLSRLVDIQEEDDVVFTIPYKARTPWLTLPTRDQTYTNGTAAVSGYDNAVHNGVVRMYVQNTLTGPATLAEISVLMFVSAGDDIAYAVPKAPDYRYTFQPQSQETMEWQPDDSILGAKQRFEAEVNAVTTGETVASLRQLLHRANWVEVSPLGSFWEPYNTNIPTTYGSEGIKWMTTMFPRIPPAYGKHPRGTSYVQTATSTVYTPASACRTPFISYLINCFAGYRGSVIHHFNVISNGCDYLDTITATRVNRDWIVTTDRAVRNAMTSWADLNQYNLMAYLATDAAGTTLQRHESAWEGTSLTNPRTQAALSISSPNYSKWRFRPAWEFDRDLYPSDVSSNEFESIRVQGVGRKVGAAVDSAKTTWPFVDHYIAGGTDFNPVYFICTPITYLKTSVLVFNSTLWTPPIV